MGVLEGNEMECQRAAGYKVEAINFQIASEANKVVVEQDLR